VKIASSGPQNVASDEGQRLNNHSVKQTFHYMRNPNVRIEKDNSLIF
jgi:hypothetical protein